MAILSDEDKRNLKKIFSENLNKEVRIDVVLDNDKNMESSKIAMELLQELAELTDKIIVNFIDSASDDGRKYLEENNLNIDIYGNRKGPIITFPERLNIVWLGLPAGEEFPVFLEQIINISKDNISLSLEAAKIIREIKGNLDVLIFVTPTCPYCPLATHTSSMFSMLNRGLRTVIIEATEFPELSEKYSVYAVPKIAIVQDNKSLASWEGALPEVEFAKKIAEVGGYKE